MLKPTLCKSIRLPVLIITLVTLIIFSSVLAVLAWTDFTQSRTNDFRGTVGKTTVVLHKYEKTPEGHIIPRPVANASFLLYKDNHDGTWSQIGKIYTTNHYGKIKVEKLNSGKYKFVETKPGYGYLYDKDSEGNDIIEYTFKICADDAEGIATVVVEAYNRRQLSSLEIMKTVIDSGSPSAAPDYSAEEIIGDEEIYEEEIDDVDDAEENESTDLENPEEDNEDDKPETITLGHTDIEQSVSAAIADPDKEFEFTVVFSDGGTYEYSIDGHSKKWLKSGGKIYLKDGEKAIFESLPVGLYYVVSETQEPGYVTESKDNAGNIEIGITKQAKFTNKHDDPTEGKVKITVKKIVNGEIPDDEKDRVFGFTLKVNDEEPSYFTLKQDEEKIIILNSGDTYSIIEDDPFGLGYIQTSSINGMGTACSPEINVTYTNTYIGKIWQTIQGEKSWDLLDDPKAKLPDSITIELLAAGDVIQTVMVKPDRDGNWIYNFIAPKYDEDGNEIEYTIREVPVPGFISTISGNDIKNTWKGNIAIASLKVRKDVTGYAPSTDETYSFTLEALGSAPMPSGDDKISITGKNTAVFGDIIFLSEGIYTYEISEAKGDVTRCDYDTIPCTVKVVVEEVSGKLMTTSITYIKPGNSDSEEEATFTNYYRSSGTGKPDPPKPGEKVNLSIKKIWAGDQNPEQPQSVTVQLFKDGKAQGTPVTLNKDNNWRYTWIGLDKGPVWTVDETVVPAGYKKSVTGNASSGFLITNTWFKPTDIPPEKIEKVTVRGQKTWNHGNNPISSRPKGIVIYIKDGNRIAASAMITDTDHWQWCFILPKFRADGSVANYTVDEDPIPNYSKEINGYNLTNTYKPGSDSSTKPGTDEPGQNGDGSSNGKPPADGHNSPKTGDSSNLLIWLIILLISTGALILILYATRRGRRSDN